jgi:hypothetical protein
VKLLDLGIAKITDAGSAETALTTAGQLLGTPYYMSPEQWGEIPRDGRLEIDGRADIYSLGVVVYEITTGVRPFNEKTPVELRRAHCQRSPRPLEEFDASIPHAWSRAVLRAMSKDRSERQASAGEFARELRQSLGGVEALTSDARAVAPTLKGTLVSTSVAAAAHPTPQNLNAPTVRDGAQATDLAHSSGVIAPQPAPAAAPRRSWVLAMTSSRGCQVSLTVAAAAVLAVLAGGYAMLFNLNRSAQRSTESTNTTARTTQAPVASSNSSAANTNSPINGVNNPFLRYHLLLSPTALSTQRRATGEEPIPPGQSLQFVFTPRESGYIYAIGRNEQNEPIVIPLGNPLTDDAPAGVAVAASEEQAVPALARIKLNSKPSLEEFTVIFSGQPLRLPFATEPLPLDGSFRKLSMDERRQLDELRQEAAPSAVRFSGQKEAGTAVVVLSGERGSKPVVFDIKLRLRG